jgi:hypothetical protein
MERLYWEWSFSSTRTEVKTEHPAEIKTRSNEHEIIKYRIVNSSVIYYIKFKKNETIYYNDYQKTYLLLIRCLLDLLIFFSHTFYCEPGVPG